MISSASAKRLTRWLGGKAEGLVLGVVPAGAEPQHETAARDLVERGRHLRDDARDP